jgi:L-ribulose-5-phosphate 3-epimerase
MNRRTAIKALGAVASGIAARAQAPLPPPSATRTSPLICVYSGNLAKVPYAMLGDIAGQIGYEGVDLTVFPGGHVNPFIANVDMVRAVEAVRGSNLEVPMISTELTSMNNATAYAVLALAYQGAVKMFRTGYWPLNAPALRQQRLVETRRDIVGLVLLGRRCKMEAMIPNRAGAWIGHSVSEAQSLIGDMDPHWTGFYFDIAAAFADAGADAGPAAMKAALPRAKAIAVSDFHPKPGSPDVVEPCPLGQGVVDWAKVFTMLAEARFTGPISIHMDYAPKDAPNAAHNDLEFVRKQIQQSYAAAQKS